METKTKATFDKEEIRLLLLALDLYEFQDWMDNCCSDDTVRIMNKFICKLREADKMQLLIKDKE